MRKIAAVMVAVLAGTIVACGGSGTPPADAPRKLRFAVIPKALDLPVFDYARKGAERAAKAAGERRGHLARTRNWGPAQTKGDSRVVHHAACGRHRDLLSERGFPHRNHQPRHGRGHPRGHVGRRRPQVEADRVLRRRRQGGRPDHGRGSGQAAQRQGNGRTDDDRRRHEPAAAARRRSGGAREAPWHPGHRNVRRQGGFGQGGRAHRDRIESLSRSWRLDLGRGLAGLQSQRVDAGAQDARSSSRSTRSNPLRSSSRQERCRS